MSYTSLCKKCILRVKKIKINYFQKCSNPKSCYFKYSLSFIYLTMSRGLWYKSLPASAAIRWHKRNGRNRTFCYYLLEFSTDLFNLSPDLVKAFLHKRGTSFVSFFIHHHYYSLHEICLAHHGFSVCDVLIYLDLWLYFKAKKKKIYHWKKFRGIYDRGDCPSQLKTTLDEKCISILKCAQWELRFSSGPNDASYNFRQYYLLWYLWLIDWFISMRHPISGLLRLKMVLTATAELS